MQELIKIDSAPAKIGVNFEEVRERLQAELSLYDVLVTAETLPGAKKLSTELNQMAKAFDDRRKEAVAAVSAPIKAFDSQMKELVKLCKDGRQKLLDQIKTFEDEVRELARTLLGDSQARLWAKHNVRPEFRAAVYDDLVMLTAVTKSGNLASKAASELESRVLADLSLQDRTDRRLLELENASFRAGLSAPLTRDHVAGFLMADDATYSAELERIITAEIGREEEAQRRMREKLEREQQEKEAREAAQRAKEERDRQAKEAREAEDRARVECDKAQSVEPDTIGPESGDHEARSYNVSMAGRYSDPVADAQPGPAEPGKVRVTVWAKFEPEVPAHATSEQIEAALARAMEKAGITSLVSIQVETTSERTTA